MHFWGATQQHFLCGLLYKLQSCARRVGSSIGYLNIYGTLIV